MRINRKQKQTGRISLTSKEISELFAEGIVTIVLLLLINISIVVIVDDNQTFDNIIFTTKAAFAEAYNTDLLWSWRKFVIPIFFLIDSTVLFWRLQRRYHEMQLRHIITQLHYIAEGNYNHRIPFELRGDLAKIVISVNGLVESTVNAIEEERKIEQSKDELITNVSHDIRTPLTSIIGYLSLIEEKNYNNEEDLLKYTHIAYEKAKQMKLLVDDLFEYTKVRQPSVSLNSTNFDMIELAEQISTDFELEAHKKKMCISVKTKLKHLIMDGDTEKLVRVFNNLLSNALKYGIGGKHIFIEIEQVSTEVIITFKNDGPPIPKKSLDRLFDRFYRVDTSRSQEISGSGLGLAITQSIISLHGGYIYATSDDSWTSFIIHLPLKQI